MATAEARAARAMIRTASAEALNQPVDGVSRAQAVLRVLPGETVDVTSSAPFGQTVEEHDDMYLAHLCAVFEARGILLSHRHQSPTSLPPPINSTDPELQTSSNRSAIKQRLAELELGLERRLDATTRADGRPREEGDRICTPRLVRVCDGYRLSPKEAVALQWIVLHNLGFEFGTSASEYNDRGQVRNMQLISGLSVRETVEFLADNRLHIQQGLFEADSEMTLDQTFRTLCFKVSREALAVMVGTRSITATEFIKIDNTVLAEVLEEEGVIPLPSYDGPSPQQTLDGDEAVGEQDLEDAVDVEALLKQVEMVEVQPDLEVPTPDGLQPYRDDLAYLSDCFQVVALRLRIYNLKMKDESEQAGWGNNPRPELVVRQLESRERCAVRSISARLGVTPDPAKTLRIERLRQNQGFSEFEVMVLVTLIGGIISQEVRKAAQAEYSARGQGTFIFDVGTILAMHIPGNLAEQVAQRRCFYQGGSLVKTGVVRVNSMGSRGGCMGDLMDCTVEIDRRMLDFCVGLDTEFAELVEAAELFTPTVNLDRVMLPEHQKKLLLRSVGGFERFKRYRKKAGIDDVVPLPWHSIGCHGTRLTQPWHLIDCHGTRLAVMALDWLNHGTRLAVMALIDRIVALDWLGSWHSIDRIMAPD